MNQKASVYNYCNVKKYTAENQWVVFDICFFVYPCQKNVLSLLTVICNAVTISIAS